MKTRRIEDHFAETRRGGLCSAVAPVLVPAPLASAALAQRRATRSRSSNMATHWPHRGSMIDPGVASSMFCLDARLKCPNGPTICPNGHDYVFTTRRGPDSPLQFT